MYVFQKSNKYNDKKYLKKIFSKILVDFEIMSVR